MAGGMNSGSMRDVGLHRLARAAKAAQAEEATDATSQDDDPAGPWRPVLSQVKNDPQLGGEALAYALGATSVPVDQLHAIPPDVMERVAARAHAFLIDHRPERPVDPRKAVPEPD